MLSPDIRVARIATSIANRVVSYARNVKGQFWLVEQEFDADRLSTFNVASGAKARIGNGEWFRWCPPAVDSMVVRMSGQETALTEA